MSYVSAELLVGATVTWAYGHDRYAGCSNGPHVWPFAYHPQATVVAVAINKERIYLVLKAPDGALGTALAYICRVVSPANAPQPDAQLLDAIEQFIMWPGPATVEIHENGANQVVVKGTGSGPLNHTYVGDGLRQVLANWATAVEELKLKKRAP